MNTRCLPLVSRLITCSLLSIGFALPAHAAAKIEFPAASPAGSVKQRVGVTDIEVEYSRPSVKGRKIFGGLESYGTVWRTGANTATRISFSTPVKFGGVQIPAGAYALYSIPGENEWTVILNQATGQWGSYAYDQKNDAARVKTTPIALSRPVETFTINLNQLRNESAALELSWESILVSVKIETDLASTLVPQIEAAMASDEAKKPYAQAAMFYFEQNLDLKKAAAWMDAAITADPKAFYLVYRKALILEKLGDKAGAIAAAEQSLAAARKQTGPIKEEYVRLNEAFLARVR